tara:strand:- start:71294 stop:71767 length:474 start_codon:yes stop_codon:yes gene_type:complete
MSKKIGFDIHGVLDKNPELFSDIINRFRELNYEIHILTGSLIDKKLIDEIRSYNIKYDYIFSILGYHRKIGTEMWENEHGWWIDDDVWEGTKAIYCKNNNINFHIDDSRLYGNHFETPFGHITPIQENPRILEISGDVDTEILNVLKSYEGYYKMKF